jgi:ribosome recycling factor
MTKLELKSKFDKSIEHLQEELGKVRTGRASPAILESVKVKAYDTTMNVREVGSITVLDPQNLVVSPWDKSLLNEIAKGIRDGGLGLNPIVDGDLVRVPIPDLSEERRTELTKVVATKVEEVKNAMRNVRQEAMKEIEAQFSAKQIGEDEKFRLKEETDAVTKEYTDKAEELAEQKRKDLLQI